MRIKIVLMVIGISLGLTACNPEARARAESAEEFVLLVSERLPNGWTLREHSYASNTLTMEFRVLNPRDLEFNNLDRITQESMLFTFCPRRNEQEQLSQPDFEVRINAHGANGDVFPTISCGN